MGGAVAKYPKPGSSPLILMELQIHPAVQEEEPLLRRLLADYLVELTTFEIAGADREAAPSYHSLPLYWSECDRFPVLIRIEEEVAGFALMRREPRESTVDWQLAEFCVLPGHRKQGVGQAAIERLFGQSPGRWELEVLVANTPAVAFWKKCLERPGVKNVHTEPILKEDGSRLLHRFTVVAQDSPLSE